MSYEEIKKFEPFWGEWYIKEQIGSGSVGDVFKIYKKEHGRVYISALKIIKIPTNVQKENFNTFNSSLGNNTSPTEFFGDIVENIMKEIDLLYNLKGNSNIVSLEDTAVKKIYKEDKWYIMVRMEYLTPLSKTITQKSFVEDDIIKLAIDLCSALNICHKKNIFHRDIKEANVFITDDNNYKLGDFSVAKLSDGESKAFTQVGTLNYMAPEILQGKSYTTNTDIYSLGLMMYKIINHNRFPFMPKYPEKITANDIEDAISKRLSGKIFDKPMNCSNHLFKVISKACAIVPEKRYQSVEEFKNDLLKIQNKNFSEINIDINSLNTTNTISGNYQTNNQTYDIFGINQNRQKTDSKNIEKNYEDTNKNNKKSSFLKIILPVFLIIIISTSIIVFLKNKNDDTLNISYSKETDIDSIENNETTDLSTEKISNTPTSTTSPTESITPTESLIEEDNIQNLEDDELENVKTIGDNLIKNAGAEEIFNNWEKSGDLIASTKDSFNGNTSFFFNPWIDPATMNQTISIKKNTYYLISCYSKSKYDEDVIFSLQLKFDNGEQSLDTGISTSDDWKLYRRVIQIPDTILNTETTFSVTGGGTLSEIYLDDIIFIEIQI
jgi:serine/threonine protein kinase